MFKEGFKWRRFAIYGADFETFSNNSKYYQEHGDTDVYAISCKRCELSFNNKIHRYVKINPNEPRRYKLNYFIKISDYIYHYINDPRHYGKYQIHFFHNGSGFDFNFIRKWLLFEQSDFKPLAPQLYNEKDEEGSYYEDINGGKKFQSIKLFKNGVELEFRDSMLLWRTSIKALSETMKTLGEEDIPKTDLDPDHVQQPFTSVEEMLKDKMINERVGNDSLILAQWITNRLSDGVTFCVGSKIPFSAPSLAKDWFANELVQELNLTTKEDKKRVWDIAFKVDADSRENVNAYWLNHGFYKGGICSFKLDEQNKTIDKKIYSFDVNSLYPSVSVDYLPVGKPHKSKKLKKDWSKYYCFVEVKFNHIKQLVRNVPAYCSINWTVANDPEVVKFKSERAKQEHKTQYLYELNVPCWIMLSKAEFDVLNNKDWFEWDYQVVNWWYFEKSYLLKNFMLKNYQLKQECGQDESKATIKASAKLKMNSLTGKFGEKPNKETYIPLSIFDDTYLEGGKYLRVDAGNTDSTKYEQVKLMRISWKDYCYYPVICAITSGGRAKLMRTSIEQALKHHGNVYYSDTDSMKADFLLDADLVDDNELGKWKNEGSCNYFKIIRAKVYAGSQDGVNFDTKEKNGKIKVKWLASSGVGQLDIVKRYNFEQFNENIEIPLLVPMKTQSRQIILVKTMKKICNIISR